MKSRNIKGYLATLLGATFWGLSGTCAHYLMHFRNIDPLTLSAYRMICAGIIMFITTAIVEKKEAFRIFKNKEHTALLFFFSIFGIASTQITYLITISYTNAPTATVIQYTGIVMIVVLVCILERRLPTGYESFSIIFAIIGTFFLATGGNINTLVISNEGLFFGALSAIAIMIYTLVPGKLLREYGAVNITSLATFISGIMVFIAVRPKMPEVIDSKILFAFFGLTVMGTVVSYTLYFLGLSIIGPVKTSLIACVEPISSLVFSVLLLKEKVIMMDLVGIISILLAVFILALKDLKEMKKRDSKV